MPDDRDDGDNGVYLPNITNIDVPFPAGNAPADRPKPKPTRRWRPVIILAAVAFVAAMMVATGSWGDLLVLAAIAGVIVLGAALAGKKRPARQRELRRPRSRVREARGDRRMELHVWCEFEIDHEPTMIEAVEAVLADLREDQERRSWSGR